MDSRPSVSTSASLLGLLAALVLFGIYSFPRHPLLLPDLAQQGGYDYFHYFATTRALDAGVQDVYLSDEMARFSRDLSAGRWEIRDNHPLPFYLFYIPLAALDFQTGYMVHLWLGVLLYAAGVLALTLVLFRDRRLAASLAALLWAASLVTGPGVDNIWLGQVGYLLAFTLCMTFVLGATGRPAAAGFFLALAVLLKLYPLVLACYYLRRGQGRVVVWMAVTLAGLGLLAGLDWGFGHYAHYLEWSGQSGYRSVLSNQSLMGLLALLLGEDSRTTLKVLNVVLLVAAACALWRAGRVWGGSGREEQLLEFSAWVLVSTILAPLSWGHHHLVLVLPLLAFAALASHRPQHRTLGLVGLGLVCLTWWLDGEVVTREWVRDLHFQCCLWRVNLGMLLAVLGASLVGMARTRKDT